MMNNQNKEEYIDDGRSYADMSILPKERERQQYLQEIQQNDKDKLQLTGKETFWALAGAMSATILIGLVYVVVFGLIILIMYLAIKSK